MRCTYCALCPAGNSDRCWTRAAEVAIVTNLAVSRDLQPILRTDAEVAHKWTKSLKTVNPFITLNEFIRRICVWDVEALASLPAMHAFDIAYELHIGSRLSTCR